ncbi:unnamed protein product (macronuclear) [Paramecium tetraurelia]|uniref:Uncharacterized protein n=1 Tax=Paramecium tetraurelia TaxID=5888 RepID=A0D5Q2_PARTE|nr:uncharacterized protein GSPATT00013799001 [Paramecium tetraurelia]CAK78369.1 unnamed protein product [Paramecium tetraurelia]|eukprot:XP_001445766.1 hypothetical protein (macronuclear) [Paramecium tetraurelia strain d4-2]
MYIGSSKLTKRKLSMIANLNVPYSFQNCKFLSQLVLPGIQINVKCLHEGKHYHQQNIHYFQEMQEFLKNRKEQLLPVIEQLLQIESLVVRLQNGLINKYEISEKMYQVQTKVLFVVKFEIEVEQQKQHYLQRN